jgi:hypothetical protein
MAPTPPFGRPNAPAATAESLRATYKERAANQGGPDDIAQWEKVPTSAQAAVYSAIRHYLRPIEAAGTDEAVAVMAKMREIPAKHIR